MIGAKKAWVGSFNASKEVREILLFLTKLALIYLVWRMFSIAMGQEAQPMGDRLWPAASMLWEQFNDLLKVNLVFFSRVILTAMGYEVAVLGNDVVKVVGYGGVGIGNYCLALELFILFIALVASYPASWKHKLWFIPAGVLSIHALNAVRVISLNLLTVYYPQYADFNHHFTFRIVVFIYILLLYAYFVRKYGNSSQA